MTADPKPDPEMEAASLQAHQQGDYLTSAQYIAELKQGTPEEWSVKLNGEILQDGFSSEQAAYDWIHSQVDGDVSNFSVERKAA